jgi:hypothetical protein
MSTRDTLTGLVITFYTPLHFLLLLNSYDCVTLLHIKLLQGKGEGKVYANKKTLKCVSQSDQLHAPPDLSYRISQCPTSVNPHTSQGLKVMIRKVNHFVCGEAFMCLYDLVNGRE